MEPASPDAISVKGTRGAAEQQQGLPTCTPAGINCGLVVRLQSTKNNNFSWWLLRFW